MTILAPDPIFQAFSPNGGFLVGGLLYTYAAGTTTPQATYTDSTGTTPNTNPVVLNAYGAAPVWLSAGVAYKFNLTDSAGNQIPGYPVDQIASTQTFPAVGSSILPALTNTYNLGAAAATWANGYFGTAVYVNGAPALTNPLSAFETAAGVTPVNFQYPVGYVDRYLTNTAPGTTDMGPAVNNAVLVALAANGSGQYGVRVVFLNGAYSIATPLVFGTANPSNMLPLTIEGQGWGTQIICNTPASTPLFNMGGHIGWTLRNFYMMGNDANKNDGIHAGAIGGTAQTNWLIENVYSQIVGESFKIADTNAGVLRHCSAWLDQPPLQIVPQTWSAANISYMLHLAGSFVNNVSIYDFVGPPNHNNLVNVSIQMDCTTSEGVAIYTADVESGSGADTESGIIVNTASSITSLTLNNIYCEGTGISLTGVFNSCINGVNDGGTGGALVLASQCRDNTFIGLNLATIADQSSTNFGNTFIGCLVRTSWTETVTGNSRRINCTVAGPAFVDWGGSANSVITYSASMTPLCNGSKGAFRIVATNSTAFTINAPTNPADGYVMTLTIANTSGGALGAITWNAIFHFAGAAQPAAPANTKNNAVTFIYNSSVWAEVSRTSADVPN